MKLSWTIGGAAMLAAPFMLVALAAAFFHPTIARADDSCTLPSSDFDQIAVIQNDPSLTSNQEVIQELALRKQLLEQTIACAQTDVASLRSTLAAATSTYGTEDIQTQLLSDLDSASEFYAIESGELAGSGIAGTKAIASNIIAWRAGTYVPLEGKVNNYLLWTQDQPLFAMAQTRMDQTQRAVNFLENATPDADLQSAFSAAYASFQDAKQQNAAAEQALAESLSPDQSIALIKQSLSSLADTYKNFFAVSSAIAALLPQ